MGNYKHMSSGPFKGNMLTASRLNRNITINETMLSVFAYVNETRHRLLNRWANDYDNALSSELMTG